MRSLIFVLPSVAVTFICWGIYGPLLHAGQFSVEEGSPPSSLKPFICVGIAYFLIAVLVPFALLRSRGEKGHWSMPGTIWSLAAGAAGAIGALGIILAFKYKGQPVYVMPLVFGCAPVVNTFVTMLMTRKIKEASWIFYFGVLVVAIGAAGVMTFKPSGHAEVHEDKQSGAITVTINGVTVDGIDAADLKAHSVEAYEEYRKYKAQSALGFGQFMIVTAFIALTALCWGAYGPVLHKGQMKMAGSRLRPFVCVGLAYFVIAVLAPLPLFSTDLADKPGWDFFSGSVWSLASGAAGAIGALGIIYAFNFGGKPIFVMPLVFGCAPVVNTFTTIITEGLFGMISSYFYLSLLLVVCGAITVLVFAPKSPPPKPAENAGQKDLSKS